MTLPKLYTLAEVAEALGMSERWLRQKIKGDDGSPPAPHTRLGHKVRFTEEQYQQLVGDHAKNDIAVRPSITTGRKRRSA